MKIATLLKSAMLFLWNLWSKLSEEEKQKIKKEILKMIEKLIRAFFQEYNKRKSNK